MKQIVCVERVYLARQLRYRVFKKLLKLKIPRPKWASCKNQYHRFGSFFIISNSENGRHSPFCDTKIVIGGEQELKSIIVM